MAEEDLCARVSSQLNVWMARSVKGPSSDFQRDLSCLVMDRHVGSHPQQNYADDLLVSPMYEHINMHNLPIHQSVSLKPPLSNT